MDASSNNTATGIHSSSNNIHNNKHRTMKWYTITEWVDQETGEILTKSQVEREDYYIVKQEYKTEIKNGTGTKLYTKKCRPSRQTKLEL